MTLKIYIRNGFGYISKVTPISFFLFLSHLLSVFFSIHLYFMSLMQSCTKIWFAFDHKQDTLVFAYIFFSYTKWIFVVILQCYCYSSLDPIDFVFMQQNGKQISRRKHIFYGNCCNEKKISLQQFCSEQLVSIQLAHVFHFKQTCNICHLRFVMFDFLRYSTFLPLITICISFFFAF